MIIEAQKNICVPNLDFSTDWSEALENCDIVIHTAARAHILNEKSTDVISEYREINTDASVNLAKQAIDFGVSRFIFISSIGVNGRVTEGIPFSHCSKTNPSSPYAVSKLEAEIALWELVADTSMELVIIRAPAIYGLDAPGNFGLISRAIKAGVPLPFGGIQNKRSLIYIKNLTNFIGICINHKKAANKLFLVSDGQDLSTPEIISVMGRLMGKKPRIFNLPHFLLKLLFKVFGKRNAMDSLLSDLQIDDSDVLDQLDWKPPFSPINMLKK